MWDRFVDGLGVGGSVAALAALLGILLLGACRARKKRRQQVTARKARSLADRSTKAIVSGSGDFLNPEDLMVGGVRYEKPTWGSMMLLRGMLIAEAEEKAAEVEANAREIARLRAELARLEAPGHELKAIRNEIAEIEDAKWCNPY